ncbi:tetratricopeptide repeat protein [Commensalibacter communis]|uniref:tetratricopeptide repeat protein n=1 Tax=Commensalibacter communis TaxID=2972786 RepID=UPI0022FF8EF9|nr:tetratricopeptide repeat protein [Commensalibacter communis]CAI3952343.1 unnamed protein product [Commensalibacter communis]CAI3954086.1 unnamed protein product [Commensalibacter communis]
MIIRQNIVFFCFTLVAGVLIFIPVTLAKDLFDDFPPNVRYYIQTLQKKAAAGDIPFQEKLANLVKDTVNGRSGNAEVQYYLSQFYKNQPDQQERYASSELSIYWLSKAAEQGYVKAQYELGSSYAADYVIMPTDASCIPIDSVKQGERWLLKAARQGYAPAQYGLFNFYQSGKNVCYGSNNDQTYFKKANFIKAQEWLNKALEQRYAAAQASLGGQYLYGIYPYPKDVQKAIDHFTQAANQGDAAGIAGLGYCAEHGLGMPKDVGKAIQYYTKAANLHDAQAINVLVDLYRDDVVYKNPEKENEFKIKSGIENCKRMIGIGCR